MVKIEMISAAAMRGFGALLGTLGATLGVHATVEFNINTAELLKDSGGTPIPENSGLIILAASTTDGTFTMPTTTAFLPGSDDTELARWDITAGFGSGILFETTAPLLLQGSFSTGDPVALFWFPDLSPSDSAPGVTTYGFYTDATGLDGGEPWTVPNDTEQRNLRFWTADSAFAGTAPNSGNASNLTTVPEPRTSAMIAAVSLAGYAAVRRYRFETGR